MGERAKGSLGHEVIYTLRPHAEIEARGVVITSAILDMKLGVDNTMTLS
jgi:hypothetical protein